MTLGRYVGAFCSALFSALVMAAITHPHGWHVPAIAVAATAIGGLVGAWLPVRRR